jgi:hypothetical protein
MMGKILGRPSLGKLKVSPWLTKYHTMKKNRPVLKHHVMKTYEEMEVQWQLYRTILNTCSSIIAKESKLNAAKEMYVGTRSFSFC